MWCLFTMGISHALWRRPSFSFRKTCLCRWRRSRLLNKIRLIFFRILAFSFIFIAIIGFLWLTQTSLKLRIGNFLSKLLGLEFLYLKEVLFENGYKCRYSAFDRWSWIAQWYQCQYSAFGRWSWIIQWVAWYQRCRWFSWSISWSTYTRTTTSGTSGSAVDSRHHSWRPDTNSEHFEHCKAKSRESR